LPFDLRAIAGEIKLGSRSKTEAIFFEAAGPAGPDPNDRRWPPRNNNRIIILRLTAR